MDCQPVVYEYESACLRFRCYDSLEPDLRWLVWETRSGYPEGHEVPAVLALMDAAINDGVPFVSVVDLSELPPVSAAPSTIPHLHEWVRKHIKAIDELTLASTVVLKESFWSPFAKRIVDAVQLIAPLKCPFLLTHRRELAEVFATSERKEKPRPRGTSAASTAPGSDTDVSPMPSRDSFNSYKDLPNSPLQGMRRTSTVCSFKSCLEIEPPNTLGIEQSDKIYFEEEELEGEKRSKRTCGNCMNYPSWWTACLAR
jgi:hypothetical protein